MIHKIEHRFHIPKESIEFDSQITPDVWRTFNAMRTGVVLNPVNGNYECYVQHPVLLTITRQIEVVLAMYIYQLNKG
jgi:hypothetical protein